MIPLIKHPTSVVFVDDDDNFLVTIGEIMQITQQTILPQYYLCSKKAAEFFSNYRIPHLADKCVEHKVSEIIGQENIAIKLSPLIQEVYNKERFNQVSIVFADYDMPKINGLDFLNQIKDSHIFKILLTGKMSSENAVQAFNEKRIDGFLNKNLSLIQTLEKVLEEKINEYFLRQTNTTRALLEKTSNSFPALIDQTFEIFFKALIAKLNIVEYYAIEAPGSFLLIDNQGNKKILWVKNKSQQEGLVEISEQLDLSKDITDTIKNGHKTLCWYYDANSSIEDSFEQYLLPAEKVQGNDEYFVAISDDISCLHLDFSKITTFNQIPERSLPISLIF